NVHVAGQHVGGGRVVAPLGVGHDQGHVQRFIIGGVPLLMQPSVCTEQVAVVGGEHHDGVVEKAGALELFVHLADLFIHVLVQLVVQPVVITVCIRGLE